VIVVIVTAAVLSIENVADVRVISRANACASSTSANPPKPDTVFAWPFWSAFPTTQPSIPSGSGGANVERQVVRLWAGYSPTATCSPQCGQDSVPVRRMARTLRVARMRSATVARLRMASAYRWSGEAAGLSYG
jgi:hypothetical protein